MNSRRGVRRRKARHKNKKRIKKFKKANENWRELLKKKITESGFYYYIGD